MNSTISKTTKKWIGIAQDDLRDAKALLELNDRFIRLISFAAQQCAEKAIKAYLVHRKLRFPNTHNIDDLLKILKSVEPELSETLKQAAILSDYAIAFRYPDASKEDLTLPMVINLVQIADKTLDTILRKLGDSI